MGAYFVYQNYGDQNRTSSTTSVKKVTPPNNPSVKNSPTNIPPEISTAFEELYKPTRVPSNSDQKDWEGKLNTVQSFLLVVKEKKWSELETVVQFFPEASGSIKPEDIIEPCEQYSVEIDKVTRVTFEPSWSWFTVRLESGHQLRIQVMKLQQKDWETPSQAKYKEGNYYVMGFEYLP